MSGSSFLRAPVRAITLLAAAALCSLGATAVVAPAPQSSHVRLDQSQAKSGPLTAQERRTAHQKEQVLRQALLEGRGRQWLEKHGMVQVSDTSDLELAATTSSMMVIDRPTVFFDKDLRRYFAMADAVWRLSDGANYWYYDAGSSCTADAACSVGGEDTFALRFSRNIIQRSVTGTFCGRADFTRSYAKFGCSTPPQDNNSSAGVYFTKQDKVYKTVKNPDSNMHRSQIIMWIDPIPCGTTVQLFSRYGHTWSSTGISSVSITTGGIEIQFTKAENRWAVASQSGTWSRAC